jgi:hypothetical protein
MTSLFGLPTHPVVVHAAVVLLPLAALMTLACAVSPALRKRYGVLTAVLAVLAMLSVGAAQRTGGSLEERVPETALVREHTHMADEVAPWAILLAGGAVIVAGYDRFIKPRLGGVASRERAMTAAMVVCAVVVAAGATYTIVQVGHSGAKAVWDKAAHTSGEGGEASGR